MSDGGFILRARVEAEQLEDELLAPAATRSAQSKGRAVAEEPDEWRTAFERDRDRIVHSKAFRRLKHKTQVFINPEDDHFVTRLTHTLQVTQIGSAIARYPPPRTSRAATPSATNTRTRDREARGTEGSAGFAADCSSWARSSSALRSSIK